MNGPETLATGFVRSLRSLRGASAIDLVASGLVAVLAVGTFAAAETFGLAGPRPVAVAYLQALASGDPARAFSLSSVKASVAGSENVSLLDSAALAAQFAHGGKLAGSYQVTSQSVSGSTAALGINLVDGGKTRHSQLVLTSDLSFLRLHPVWRVQVVPSTLIVKIPAGVGTPTVDGIPVKVPSGSTATLSVLPGHHVVGATGGPLLAGVQQPVEVDSTGSATATVVSKLTPAGEAAATAAVKQAFDRCMGLTGVPAGCPQRFFAQEVDLTDSTWKLVGDPSTGLTFAHDDAGGVSAQGSFQAVADGRTILGRGFRLPLTPSGSGLQGGAFSPLSFTFQRPSAATDAAILDGVKAGLAACAASTDPYPKNCPQSPIGTTNSVVWSLVGDPVGDAKVTFDSGNGSFTVQGGVRMGSSFDANYFGIIRHMDYVGSYFYTWTGLWDGSRFQPYRYRG